MIPDWAHELLEKMLGNSSDAPMHEAAAEHGVEVCDIESWFSTMGCERCDQCNTWMEVSEIVEETDSCRSCSRYEE